MSRQVGRQDRQVYRQTGNTGTDLPMLDAEQMALLVVDRKDKTKVDKTNI